MVRSPELPAGRYPEIWLAWLPAGRSSLPRLTWSSPGSPELPAGRYPDPCESQMAAGRSPDPFMRFLNACRFLLHVLIDKRYNTIAIANINFKHYYWRLQKSIEKKSFQYLRKVPIVAMAM